MKKFIITEEEKEKILNQHKYATKNHYIVSEALGGGLDMSSIDRMKAKYPNGIDVPTTISAKGSGVFSNGIDIINKNDPKIKEILQTISDLLNYYEGKVTVIVNGGASAVGSTTGYDNKSLAKRRRDNLISFIKSNIKNQSRLEIIPGNTTVGKATVKDSPEAKKEQFVSAQISGEGKLNVPIDGVQGDNTNVELPFRNLPKIGDGDKDIIPVPSKGKMKRVCVQIPEAYLDEFRLKVREFKNENFLDNIPYGVYDVK